MAFLRDCALRGFFRIIGGSPFNVAIRACTLVLEEICSTMFMYVYLAIATRYTYKQHAQT